MNFLFYLEPLIIQDNPYLYTGWVPLWTRLINALEKNDKVKCQFKLISGQVLKNDLTQSGLPGSVDIITFPLEAVVEKFNFSCMDASLAWYKGDYKGEQLRHTARLVASKLKGWVPDVIIASSQVPFLKTLFPKALVLYFEGGMTSRPPFPPSWYLDPTGLYKYSFPAKYSDKINKEPIDQPARELLQTYRNFFVTLIDSKNIFSEYMQAQKSKFSHLVLLPLQTDGFWFQGNCDFSSEFQYLHKLLSTIDPSIGVVVTPHPGNPWFNDGIVRYFEETFPNFIYSPEFSQVSSASQYLLKHVDAVLSVTSMVGLQALIWKKKLFSIGETQLKVGAEYCFKTDLSDIDKLPQLLKKPTPDRDHVLFWLLTHFYVPEFYFYDPNWIIQRITSLLKANASRTLSPNTFSLIDAPEKVFFTLMRNAILDIPRTRGKELEKPEVTYEEKVAGIQQTFSGLKTHTQADLWQSVMKRNYGEEVIFTAAENNSLLLMRGWSQPENWGAWSLASEADVLIVLDHKPGKNVEMCGEFLAFINEQHPVQKVDVWVNGEKTATWKFEHGKPVPNTQLIIPASVFEKSPDQTHIRFVVDAPVSPAMLGMSSDSRMLGIAMHALSFDLVD